MMRTLLVDKFPQPLDWDLFFDTFNDELSLTSNEPVAASSGWVGTALAAGTTAFSTDEQFGVVVLSGAATTDNSGSQMQRDMEFNALITGKKTRIVGRFKLSESTQSHFFMGLSITDTTVLDGADGIAGLTPSDCVGVFKADGDDLLELVVIRDSVVVVRSSIYNGLANDTYYHFAVEVQMDADTAGKGVVKGFLYAAPFTTTAPTLIGETGPVQGLTMPYSAEEILAPTMAFASGSATGTQTCTIDYIGVGQEC